LRTFVRLRRNILLGIMEVGRNVFIWCGNHLGHEVAIGRESFVGAGCVVTKSAEAGSVVVAPDMPKFRLNSASLLRLTKMK
jgi:serine acetyltransferase